MAFFPQRSEGMIRALRIAHPRSPEVSSSERERERASFFWLTLREGVRDAFYFILLFKGQFSKFNASKGGNTDDNSKEEK